ncbi:protein DA1-related 1-like isoform X1 [Vigna umbellata]|uniref:protein DA1-related 1-like isoform X1 n=1 Tax=Vigna umbellata TaxID=87088 RepID=UPI001F5E49E2|nr:protein DA1-related 1-like isoform X1 [Vigna umbellata]XP_047155357.1 protein DA1-related 1-like isoform X1 [Vigna umbellata]XP_047155365.1 protein DA1-related 1-like isoform X1 [Vigna umbellata]XP_047155373.1 protein DA1-related 1-like isoform X1 [Vigna umbellata]XP_047155382.1 protein DA1-related 1-like isoform X1 [Vigna umbellata]
MGWFRKLLKGSDHISRGQYQGKYGEDRIWDTHRSSMDDLTDIEKEDIDRAIALSLSEEDHLKGKKVVEDDSQSEDDKLCKIDDEEDEYLAKIQQEDEYLAKIQQEDEYLAKIQQEEDERLAKIQQEHERLAKLQQDEDERLAKIQQEHERLAKLQQDEDERLAKIQQDEVEHLAKAQLEEDEQLARAIQESLTIDSPPRSDNDSSFLSYPHLFPPGYRTCAGCKTEIGHGRFLSCMGGVWHPECFCCHACRLPITDYEFSMSSNRPYHKSCYREKHHPRCDVCKSFIPTNSSGLIEYRAHPFWLQKYCPSHELDGTPRCCSCERMEPRDAKYLLLDDGRKLCLECLDSSIMDTHECQPLYLEIQEFYEGLNMKLEQQIPMLLVERQALNEAMEGEKNGHHHLPETRGLCLSEEQTVTTISRRPRIGAGYRVTDMITEPFKLIRRCEVTAILVLYGLPRLLTGSILAHEMMHAWLRLKGYPNLSPEVEEGICQVLAHMWLDSELYSGSGNGGASSSSSSSSSSPSSSSASSKKGKRSDFEKKLGEFFKHQIESDTSSAYGDGFRSGNKAMLKYGLKSTLDHIHMTGSFPY